ncbi:MAG: GldG family protein [Moorellales bacterium]
MWQRHSQRWILVAAVVGLVVLANVMGARHHWRWDLTASKKYSLSVQTREVLGRLEQPVRLLAFLEKGSEEAEKLEDLLREYDYASPKVSFEVVDPVAEPALTQRYGVQYYNTVVVEVGNQSRKVEPYNIFGLGGSMYGSEFRGEQAVTRAIVDLVHQTAAVVYFLEGHGEGSLDQDFSDFRDFLEGDGYTVKSLNLATSGKVPADASVVVLGGPRQDLPTPEVEALKQYLAGGGRLLALIDPLPRPLPQLEGLLAGLGIKLHQDVVVDPQRAFFLDALSPVPVLEWHAITEKMLEQKVNLVLPRARSLAAAVPGDQKELKVETLLRSSDGAWGETDLAADKARRDERDLAGPLTYAVAVSRAKGATEKTAQPDQEQEAPDKQPVAIVVGNSGLARNQALGFQGNADFLVNGVNWLLGEEQMLTIRPKAEEVRLVQMEAGQAALVFYGTTFFLPLAILALGLGVWLRRRAR